MKQIAASTLILGLAAAGCDALSGLISPSTVTVSLVNASSFDVEAELFIADQQEIPEFLLTQVGEKLNYTIPAGESMTFSRSCDELQAIVVAEADLRVLGGVGPEASSDVLRDGDDFGCGDRITFTFTHSALIVDFQITTEVR